MILTPAPPGFDATAALDPAALGPILADHVDADGRDIVIRGPSGDLHIRLQDADSADRPAVILPADNMVELRFDVASRFLQRLRGKRIALLPRALQLTSLQRVRLTHLLLAHDIQELGGGPRDIAAELISSLQAALPSIEWKDSAARRHANRLIHDSLALVNGGYLRLLRGK